MEKVGETQHWTLMFYIRLKDELRITVWSQGCLLDYFYTFVCSVRICYKINNNCPTSHIARYNTVRTELRDFFKIRSLRG